MRKIYFKYYTGYAGMDSAEVVEFDDDISDQELDDLVWQGALQNAESYGVYPSEDNEDNECSDNYSDNIEGYWEDYVAAKHDGTY